jgi:hypothetical protein
MDVSQPSMRLAVDIVSESGEAIMTVLADRYRADVQKAGYGDGHYGFAVQSSKLRAIRRPRFFCGQPRVELRPPSRPAAAGAKTWERASLLLHLDGHPTGPRLAGWAMDRDRLGERRRLQLRAGSRFLAVQRATLFRPDSMAAGGDGFHGFWMPLPPDTNNLYIDDMTTGLEFRIS